MILNDSKAPFSKHKTLNQGFEEAVQVFGDHIALAFQDRELSYEEANKFSNQVAHALIQKGIKRGDHVAILTERSPEMIIAIMGVVKAGGVYIPIDLAQPQKRINQILKSVQANFAIAYGVVFDLLQNLHTSNPYIHSILCLDDTKWPSAASALPITSLEEIQTQASHNPEPVASPEDLAYVIHTSGSTGVPKGVVVKHRAAINVIEWVNTRYEVKETDKLLFITSIGFDLSVYDIFGTLATGACIQIAKKEDIQDPRILAKLIAKHSITIWDSTPGTLNQLIPYLEDLAHETQQFRLAMLSGDWIPLSLPPALKRLYKNIQVLSMGGATEATIWSNYFDVYDLDPSWKSVPYGKPIQNCRYFIFDPNMNVCPIHIEGDLYIGGECVAEGYLNKPELTHDRFIDNPFFPGQKIYKTGDRARWFPDGNMEFLGRIDHQIKLRGYRIELGEIESQLLTYPGLSAAIVMVKTFSPGDRRLVAFYTADAEISNTDLKTHLNDRLPAYMIPSEISFIEQIPITPIGKVDRKALLRMESSSESNKVEDLNALSETGKKIWGHLEAGLGRTETAPGGQFFRAGRSFFLGHPGKQYDDRRARKRTQVCEFYQSQFTGVYHQL